jgi:glycogen operon protein
VELILFDGDAPVESICLDPDRDRTFCYWHAFVHGVEAGQLYGYRVDGPFEPKTGLRFDRDKVLVDPYAREVIVGPGYDRRAASGPGDNLNLCMKSVVVDGSDYDWEGDRPLNRPLSETVIYELHVRGFTHSPDSGVPAAKRGTFAGLVEKIPYLKELGVTAVELLPVFQFDEQDAPEGLINYWGYSPICFFAPHRKYSSDRRPMGPTNEFRSLVKELHRAGIEVILDVVYNHTAEGNESGPTLSLKGLENRIYYLLDSNRAKYTNYSGTGNTLNANHSIVRRMILDSLHFWVEEMHVDGFRFDLASILSRDENGEPMENPPILWDIESDPRLASTKLIAEAWDAAGLYQVGTFVGDRWQEWNGKFRDDVRRFFRCDRGSVRDLAPRLIGSPDLYGHEDREPQQSINFVTCHDGFTLNDLVSYNVKHNQANKEKNRDGHNENFSWNCGVEGPSSNPRVEKLRHQQIKNLLTITMISLGTPMILMGDEVRRTQLGNNNAYCQDNPISWFDWSLTQRHKDLFEFVKKLIALRLRLEEVEGSDAVSLMRLLKRANIRWHGVEADRPDWTEHSHSLAFSARSLIDHRHYHVMLSAYWRPLRFRVPTLGQDLMWKRIIDTSFPPPHEIYSWSEAPAIEVGYYRVAPHSVVVLHARRVSKRGK